MLCFNLSKVQVVYWKILTDDAMTLMSGAWRDIFAFLSSPTCALEELDLSLSPFNLTPIRKLDF